MSYYNNKGDYCGDCGQYLKDNELDTGVCSICTNSTHIEYRSSITNAYAAWQAAKERAKQDKIEPVTMEPSIRKLKIK